MDNLVAEWLYGPNFGRKNESLALPNGADGMEARIFNNALRTFFFKFLHTSIVVSGGLFSRATRNQVSKGMQFR